MNTNKLRTLAASALAFAVALEAFDAGAESVERKLVAQAVRANTKSVAKTTKKPAKRKAKSAKVAAKKVAKPAAKTDDASARMRILTAIHAGQNTKGAITKVTNLSDTVLTRLLLAMKADKSIWMTGERRGAKYHAPPKSTVNGAVKHEPTAAPASTIEA